MVDRLHADLNKTMQGMFAEAREDLAATLSPLPGGPAPAASPPAASPGPKPAPESVDETIEGILKGK
jgi:hypothetical protein